LEQYEIVVPTLISDRVCQRATKCTSSQFEAVPISFSADRLVYDAVKCLWLIVEMESGQISFVELFKG
jgi:hypothetical protein